MNLLCGAGCGAGVAVLMFLTARALLAQGGSRATLGPLLAAGSLVSLPSVFHQATECEKYAPHLLLALALVYTALTAGTRPYRPAFAWGVALAHHPQAVLLAPLLWPWRSILRRPPELALAAALVLLPVSVKVVYPALRAQAAVAAPALTNWGEPRTAAALARYLTVRQYGDRFGAGRGSFARRLAPQLAAQGAELGTWPLVFAWLGAVGLLRVVPAVGGPVFLLVPLAWLFAGSFQLPLHLASANALVPCAVAWLGAAWSVSRLPCLLAPAALFLLALSGRDLAAARLPAEAQDRRTAVFDYNRALLRAAPPRAILLAGLDNDLFPLRYLTGVLGERPDVTVLDAPGQGKAADYRAMVRRVAPGFDLPAGPDRDPAALLHAMLHAPGSRCVVFSGFLEAVLPGELRFAGPLAFDPARPCRALPPAARLPRLWDRLAWRSVRDPFARTPRLLAVTGVYEAGLSVSINAALREGRVADAAPLLAVKQRRFPGLPSTALEEGTMALLRHDAGAAVAAYDRAIAADPALLDGYVQLALLLDAAGDRPGLLRLVRRLKASRTDLDPSLVRAAEAAPGGATVRALLARAALDDADALRDEGIAATRRIAVLRALAGRLGPSPAGDTGRGVGQRRR